MLYVSNMADRERRNVRIVTLFTETELSELDEWISLQKFQITRSEALRYLLRRGYVAEEAETAH